MALTFNGTSPTAINYNGTSLTKVIYNGVTVWQKNTAATYEIADFNLSATFTRSSIYDDRGEDITGHSYSGSTYASTTKTISYTIPSGATVKKATLTFDHSMTFSGTAFNSGAGGFLRIEVNDGGLKDMDEWTTNTVDVTSEVSAGTSLKVLFRGGVWQNTGTTGSPYGLNSCTVKTYLKNIVLKIEFN